MTSSKDLSASPAHGAYVHAAHAAGALCTDQTRALTHRRSEHRRCATLPICTSSSARSWSVLVVRKHERAPPARGRLARRGRCGVESSALRLGDGGGAWRGSCVGALQRASKSSRVSQTEAFADGRMRHLPGACAQKRARRCHCGLARHAGLPRTSPCYTLQPKLTFIATFKHVARGGT